MPAQKFFLRAVLAAALALSATSVFAASGNWTNTAATGLWSTALNWSPNAVPGTAAGDAVNLNANLTNTTTLITLDTSAIVGTMIYGDSSGTSALNFTNSDGSTLTFNNNGFASTLTFQGYSLPGYNVPILLANDLSMINNTGNSGAVVTFNGTISASTSGSKTITNSLGVTYGGAISDGSGQVALYQDSGTVTLSASNSFSGGVIFRRGTLVLGNSNALGTGTLLLTNTASITLSVTTNMTVTNMVTLGNATVGGGTNAITLGGKVTQVGASSLNRVGDTIITGNVYLSATNSAGKNLTLGGNNNGSGSISGNIANYEGGAGTASGIIKLGTGIWTLSGANTYTGSTTVGSSGGTSGGTLILTNSGSLGTGQLSVYAGTADLRTSQTISSGVLVGQGASGTTATVTLGTGVSLGIGGDITYSASNNPNGGTISGGTINLLGNRVFNVGDSSAASVDLTVSSIVANGDGTARNVRKLGAGVLALSGANEYTGTTTVEGGVLNIQNATALGSTAAGTTVNSGMALQIQGGITVGAEALTLNGTGISSDGALRNISGNNTYGGTITNATASRINSDSGTLTLSGNINATNQAITFGGVGNIVANGAITNSTAGLTKDGAGTLTLSAANTYSGATTVSGGTLAVNGSINSAATVQSGATLAGTGSVKSATIASGGTISPGNSPGKLTLTNGMTWDGGGNYNWQIFDVADPSKRDLIDVTGGTFTLNGISELNKFNINLWSLSGLGPDTNGAVYNFNNTQSYSWRIVSSANPISGTFSNSFFNINTGPVNGTGGFANDLGGGLFSVAMDGNNLNLVFTPGSSPIPEPGTWAAAALLAGTAGFMRWRRRRA